MFQRQPWIQGWCGNPVKCCHLHWNTVRSTYTFATTQESVQRGPLLSACPSAHGHSLIVAEETHKPSGLQRRLEQASGSQRTYIRTHRMIHTVLILLSNTSRFGVHLQSWSLTTENIQNRWTSITHLNASFVCFFHYELLYIKHQLCFINFLQFLKKYIYICMPLLL